MTPPTRPGQNAAAASAAFPLRHPPEVRQRSTTENSKGPARTSPSKPSPYRQGRGYDMYDHRSILARTGRLTADAQTRVLDADQIHDRAGGEEE